MNRFTIMFIIMLLAVVGYHTDKQQLFNGVTIQEAIAADSKKTVDKKKSIARRKTIAENKRKAAEAKKAAKATNLDDEFRKNTERMLEKEKIRNKALNAMGASATKLISPTGALAIKITIPLIVLGIIISLIAESTTLYAIIRQSALLVCISITIFTSIYLYQKITIMYEAFLFTTKSKVTWGAISGKNKLLSIKGGTSSHYQFKYKFKTEAGDIIEGTHGPIPYEIYETTKRRKKVKVQYVLNNTGEVIRQRLLLKGVLEEVETISNEKLIVVACIFFISFFFSISLYLRWKIDKIGLVVKGKIIRKIEQLDGTKIIIRYKYDHLFKKGQISETAMSAFDSRANRLNNGQTIEVFYLKQTPDKSALYLGLTLNHPFRMYAFLKNINNPTGGTGEKLAVSTTNPFYLNESVNVPDDRRQDDRRSEEDDKKAKKVVPEEEVDEEQERDTLDRRAQDERRKGGDRRSGKERRQKNEPVDEERRSGKDRRKGDRRTYW